MGNPQILPLCVTASHAFGKNFSENSLGQEMLNEHLFNCDIGKVRIDRCTANFQECREGLRETLVFASLLFNQIEKSVR